MTQPCLFNCRCASSPAEADRYGLIGETHCDPSTGECLAANRSKIVQVLKVLGGLDFPDLPNRVPIPTLPRAVSTIRGDSAPPIGLSLLGPVLATRYTEVGGLRSNPISIDKVATWRKRRGIPDHRRVLLLQETGDAALESLFPATLRPAFFAAVATIGNVVLVSPGYSVYDNGTMCEWLQLINLKRSVHFAHQANVAGIPCIPSIGWHRDRPADLERLAAWLSRQGDRVTHLAVNTQTGSEKLWAALVQGMTFLERETNRSYNWLVCGGTDSLYVVFGRFPFSRVTHVSATVPTYTRNHRLLGQSGTVDLPPDELLRQNLEREHLRRSAAAIIGGQSEHVAVLT